MKGLQGERIRQAFMYLDKDGSGYIAAGDFARIIKEMAAHKLNDRILDRLPTLCQLTASGRVSYSELRAFINVRPKHISSDDTDLLHRSLKRSI